MFHFVPRSTKKNYCARNRTRNQRPLRNQQLISILHTHTRTHTPRTAGGDARRRAGVPRRPRRPPAWAWAGPSFLCLPRGVAVQMDGALRELRRWMGRCAGCAEHELTDSRAHPHTHARERTHSRMQASANTTRTHARMRARARAHTHTQKYACTHAHAHERTNARARARTNARTHARMHPPTHTRARARTNALARTHKQRARTNTAAPLSGSDSDGAGARAVQTRRERRAASGCDNPPASCCVGGGRPSRRATTRAAPRRGNRRAGTGRGCFIM